MKALGAIARFLRSEYEKGGLAPRRERRRAARERHRRGGELWTASDRHLTEPEGMPISEASYVEPVVKWHGGGH